MSESVAPAWKKETKKATIQYFKEKLSSDDRWALKGLIAIYGNQTQEEQASDMTKVDNKIGFSAFDAEILSSFAKQYQQRGFLSPKQVALLHKRIPKYAGQLYSMVSKDATTR